MNQIQISEQMIKALGSGQDQLKRVFDLFPLGVIMTDIEGRVTYYNQAQSKIDNLDPEEIIGLLEIEVLEPVVGPNIMNVCQKTGQPILGYIYPYRTKKGRIVNAAYWVFPIFDGQAVTGAICFTQPLLGEYHLERPYRNQPIQWASSVPINMPQKNIVGNNQAFQKAVMTVKNNAANPIALLIAGETGSGKEMLAKLAHQASSRRNKPYMALNCSAIPSTLIEGLLFGTVKGSFTGAIDRPGLMEEAEGGTLYLDEIDSMPLDLQPKLLRAIQEMQICRVGSSNKIKLDFKLVSSIGSSPQNALSSGRLRADLFYRLAVMMVNVPPLRERLDDLELLAEHFICKYNNILGKSALKIEARLLNMMKSYHWPGNVRELEHMLAGSLTMVKDENIIQLEHVPEHYIQAFASDNNQNGLFVNKIAPIKTEASALNEVQETFEGPSPIERLKREERKLRECLTEAQGNISKAAKIMGVSRQLFSYRLLKYGLNHRDFKN